MQQRLPRLLAHGFGLWDVLGACERKGSLDSAIRKPAANDFARLREFVRCWNTVGFNGQASGNSRRSLPPWLPHAGVAIHIACPCKHVVRKRNWKRGVNYCSDNAALLGATPATPDQLSSNLSAEASFSIGAGSRAPARRRARLHSCRAQRSPLLPCEMDEFAQPGFNRPSYQRMTYKNSDGFVDQVERSPVHPCRCRKESPDTFEIGRRRTGLNNF